VTRFARSVVTSTFTTSLDFVVLTALVELAGTTYALATFVGTLVGATSNFVINRAWAFEATAGHPGRQAVRYVMVQIGSAVIHTLGVWSLTRFAGVQYLVAKFGVACAAYLGWNYPLNHRFVFPRSRAPAPSLLHLRDGTRDRTQVSSGAELET